MVFVAPFLIFIAVVFLAPLLTVFYFSLGPTDFEFSTPLTLDYYREFFTGDLYIQVLWTTIEISFLAALIVLVFGYPVAYYLAKQPPRKRMLLSMILLLTFYTSILVKSFAFTVLLGYNGIVNSAISGLFGDDFRIPMLFNRTGTMIGIAEHFLPYMVFPILTSILAQDQAVHKAAEIMGAGRTRIFWRITFPLSMPGVLAGVLLVTILTVGQFIIPALLGGPADMMMANLVDFHINEAFDWSMASVISVILLVLSSAFIVVLAKVRGGQMFADRRH
jgi:putative spermidine/putrescine transport system permease protein